MALSHALLVAKVAHARARPAHNAFRYHVYYICAALREWPQVSRLAAFRRRLFSLLPADYGHGMEPEAWMRGLLAEQGITAANGEIELLTMPRVLGFAFNPVSFWFCLDAAGMVRAVLADVRNTFGERHAYLLAHADQRAIGQDDWFSSEKVFHVSPFIPVSGHYEFRFAYSKEAIGVFINHHDEQGLLLSTSLAGKRQPLTSAALVYCFFRYPLVTFKVVGLIHYQALKLFFKRVRYRNKPTPPTLEVTR